MGEDDGSESAADNILRGELELARKRKKKQEKTRILREVGDPGAFALLGHGIRKRYF